jgi:hypothetical protein
MTTRTFVSHAAAFLLGLMVAGGVGMWAVGQERGRAERAEAEAREAARRAAESPAQEALNRRAGRDAGEAGARGAHRACRCASLTARKYSSFSSPRSCRQLTVSSLPSAAPWPRRSWTSTSPLSRRRAVRV